MMRNIIKIVFQIIGSILLAAFILWLISYLIGVNIYVREMRLVSKKSDLNEQIRYESDRNNKIYNHVNIYKLIFAGGGWRVRAVNMLNKKVFEYFPEEADNSADALTHLADSYTWLGGRKNGHKAISLYRKATEVFKREHFLEEAPTGKDPKGYELGKYNYLIVRHHLIARNYMEMKEYKDVIREYQIVIDEYSDKVKSFSLWNQYLLVGEAHERIGEIYLRCFEDYDKAMEYFTKVQELFPDPLVISRNRNNIGDCYLAMGNEERAKEIYQSVIDEFKDSKVIVDVNGARDRLEDLKRWKRVTTKIDPIL